jgi:hypothetical protein
MTLATHIRIERPAPALPLFHSIRALVGGLEAIPFKVEDADDWDLKVYGPSRLLRSGGVGLASMVWLRHGMDAPLPPVYGYDDDTDEPTDEVLAPAAAFDLMLDTGYAYQHEVDGVTYGCDSLHAAIVYAIAQRGLGDVHYKNEYSGEWHLYVPGEPIHICWRSEEPYSVEALHPLPVATPAHWLAEATA